MANRNAPSAPPQLPLGVLLGLGALLLVGGVLIGGLVALVLMRGPSRPAGPAPTVTPLPLPTRVVVIPTVTAGPTDTNTPEPTVTALPATETPEPTETEPDPQATATGEPLLTVDQGANVRSGPSTDYPIVGNLPAGATAQVFGRDVSSTWFVIETGSTGSGRGWISGLITTYSGDASALPIVAAPPPPAASATPRPPTGGGGGGGGGGGPVTGSHGVTGNLRLCNSGKTTYAVNERICFVEFIHNNASAPVSYGILGVAASNGQFQTSWSADLAPEGWLWIDPGCDGPTDRCNGAWEDGIRIGTPGTFSLVLSVCFSPFGECQSANAAWENLSQPITIRVQ
jgi:hypothetical protein